MTLGNSIGTTKITKDTNIQTDMLTPRLTSQVKSPSGDFHPALRDFVLFGLFVVSFNCGI